MAFKLKLQEPLDQGVRRVALDQIDRIRAPDADGDHARWVHEARKSLKRTRALLRLVRSGLRKDEWRELNSALRDAGRQLSVWRDRDVRLATLASLGTNARRPLAAAIERLAAHDEHPTGSPDNEPAPTADTIEVERVATVAALAAIREALATLAVDAGPATLEAGLRRTHRAARKALDHARSNPGVETFHELRKAVQLHWRQMQLLSSAWPDLFAARIATARALAQCLGREHDLAMLAASVTGDAAGNVAHSDRRLIGAACARAQEALREEACASAELLFVARPRTFAREAIAYWTAAGAKHPGPVESSDFNGHRNVSQVRPRGRSASPRRRSAETPIEGGGGRGPVQGKRGSKARAKPAGRA